MAEFLGPGPPPPHLQSLLQALPPNHSQSNKRPQSILGSKCWELQIPSQTEQLGLDPMTWVDAVQAWQEESLSVCVCVGGGGALESVPVGVHVHVM